MNKNKMIHKGGVNKAWVEVVDKHSPNPKWVKFQQDYEVGNQIEYKEIDNIVYPWDDRHTYRERYHIYSGEILEIRERNNKGSVMVRTIEDGKQTNTVVEVFYDNVIGKI